MFLYPYIALYDEKCTFCHRSTESVCTCSLPFCQIHIKQHTVRDDPLHRVAFIINKEAITYIKTENNMIESTIFMEMLKKKGNKPICEHIQQYESQLGTEKLKEPTNRDISCRDCDSTDTFICLTCLDTFCARPEIFSDGKGHMKGHHLAQIVLSEEEEKKFKRDNIQPDYETIARKHCLGLRNYQIFCYPCEKHVFSPFLFLKKLLNNKNINIEQDKYLTHLKALATLHDTKNSELYQKQREIYKLNEEQQETLFHYDGDRRMYSIRQHLDKKVQIIEKKVSDTENDKNTVWQDKNINIRGIYNTGNTCFANTTIQLLADLLRIRTRQDDLIRIFHGDKNNNDNSNFYNKNVAMDPRKCLDCQLIRAIKSLRETELSMEEVTYDTENKNFEDLKKTESFSSVIKDLDAPEKEKESQYTITVRSLSPLKLSDLLACLKSEGLVLPGEKQQDCTELLFKLLDKINTSEHFNYENNNSDRLETNNKQNYEQENILSDLSIKITSITECKSCDSCQKTVKLRFFIFYRLYKETKTILQGKCSKCGGITEKKIFLDVKKYLLMMNEVFYIDGMIKTGEIDDKIILNDFIEKKNDPDQNLNLELVNNLIGMGFPEENVKNVVRMGCDFETAIEILVNDIPTNNKDSDNKDMKTEDDIEETTSHIDNQSTTVPISNMFLSSGIKYASDSSQNGHYIYHMRVGGSDIIVNDKEVSLVERDEKLAKGYVLAVYEKN